MRVLAVLLAALMITPMAVANPGQPLLVPEIDERIGSLSDRIASANETYGPRDEFEAAKLELSRSGLALVNNATLVSEDSLIKAAGALGTGKARAQAQGSTNPSEKVVETARQKVDNARTVIQQVRGDLHSMERTGLEPVALDGGLAVGHVLIRAMDLVQQYRVSLDRWEQGDQDPRIEAGIISSASGALEMANLSRELLASVTEARAEAPIEPILTDGALDDLTGSRVSWTEDHASAAARQSRSRVLELDNQGEQLLTLSAYTIHFQDVVFNGLMTQYQRDNSDTDPYATAKDLVGNHSDDVDAWLEELDLSGELGTGAIASAEFTLRLTENTTGRQRAEAGAFAAGYIHAGVEHVGILVDAYTDATHTPGNQLPSLEATSTEEAEGSPVPGGWIIGLGALALAATAMIMWRKRR